MANGIPGAKLVIVPNCGHLTPPEQPQPTAEALVEWLRISLLLPGDERPRSGASSDFSPREDITMLRDDINNAVKDAMRAKDERKLSTLRMVNSTIKNADIAARGEGKPPLSDADLLGVFQKMIKQRQELVELYDKGGRAELANQEREEIAIISAYLPKQMSDDDVKAAIAAAIAETGAAGMKDMGKVIAVLRQITPGRWISEKPAGW